MAVAAFKVSDRGQMALPAVTRRRWEMTEGGTVEVVDLGEALVIVPAGRGGLTAMLGQAIDEAGGYDALVERAREADPDLA
ncbi:AbrB/MazE/SpoVT family DNA-binding domain-containing protein [Aquihabitans sp. McL0605]|uniref:AbrB/MazE/SpoVT family DNA-binding domain-containing protein n=1 Tax=Aquihabitans sp. McL0605 TaxID=3415671 RepID=UPI003CF3B748